MSDEESSSTTCEEESSSSGSSSESSGTEASSSVESDSEDEYESSSGSSTPLSLPDTDDVTTSSEEESESTADADSILTDLTPAQRSVQRKAPISPKRLMVDNDDASSEKEEEELSEEASASSQSESSEEEASSEEGGEESESEEESETEESSTDTSISDTVMTEQVEELRAKAGPAKAKKETATEVSESSHTSTSDTVLTEMPGKKAIDTVEEEEEESESEDSGSEASQSEEEESESEEASISEEDSSSSEEEPSSSEEEASSEDDDDTEENEEVSHSTPTSISDTVLTEMVPDEKQPVRRGKKPLPEKADSTHNSDSESEAASAGSEESDEEESSQSDQSASSEEASSEDEDDSEEESSESASSSSSEDDDDRSNSSHTSISDTVLTEQPETAKPSQDVETSERSCSSASDAVMTEQPEATTNKKASKSERRASRGSNSGKNSTDDQSPKDSKPKATSSKGKKASKSGGASRSSKSETENKVMNSEASNISAENTGATVSSKKKGKSSKKKARRESANSQSSTGSKKSVSSDKSGMSSESHKTPTEQPETTNPDTPLTPTQYHESLQCLASPTKSLNDHLSDPKKVDTQQGVLDNIELKSVGDVSEMTEDTTVKRLAGMEIGGVNSVVSNLASIEEDIMRESECETTENDEKEKDITGADQIVSDTVEAAIASTQSVQNDQNAPDQKYVAERKSSKGNFFGRLKRGLSSVVKPSFRKSSGSDLKSRKSSSEDNGPSSQEVSDFFASSGSQANSKTSNGADVSISDRASADRAFATTGGSASDEFRVVQASTTDDNSAKRTGQKRGLFRAKSMDSSHEDYPGRTSSEGSQTRPARRGLLRTKSMDSDDGSDDQPKNRFGFRRRGKLKKTYSTFLGDESDASLVESVKRHQSDKEALDDLTGSDQQLTQGTAEDVFPDAFFLPSSFDKPPDHNKSEKSGEFVSAEELMNAFGDFGGGFPPVDQPAASPGDENAGEESSQSNIKDPQSTDEEQEDASESNSADTDGTDDDGSDEDSVCDSGSSNIEGETDEDEEDFSGSSDHDEESRSESESASASHDSGSSDEESEDESHHSIAHSTDESSDGLVVDFATDISDMVSVKADHDSSNHLDFGTPDGFQASDDEGVEELSHSDLFTGIIFDSTPSPSATKKEFVSVDTGTKSDEDSDGHDEESSREAEESADEDTDPGVPVPLSPKLDRGARKKPALHESAQPGLSQDSTDTQSKRFTRPSLPLPKDPSGDKASSDDEGFSRGAPAPSKDTNGPASPLRSLAARARRRLSGGADFHAETVQPQVEIEEESSSFSEDIAYHVEELHESNIIECLSPQQGGNASSDHNKKYIGKSLDDSIGFDGSVISNALFDGDLRVDDNYHYSKDDINHYSKDYSKDDINHYSKDDLDLKPTAHSTQSNNSYSSNYNSVADQAVDMTEGTNTEPIIKTEETAPVDESNSQRRTWSFWKKPQRTDPSHFGEIPKPVVQSVLVQNSSTEGKDKTNQDKSAIKSNHRVPKRVKSDDESASDVESGSGSISNWLSRRSSNYTVASDEKPMRQPSKWSLWSGGSKEHKSAGRLSLNNSAEAKHEPLSEIPQTRRSSSSRNSYRKSSSRRGRRRDIESGEEAAPEHHRNQEKRGQCHHFGLICLVLLLAITGIAAGVGIAAVLGNKDANNKDENIPAPPTASPPTVPSGPTMAPIANQDSFNVLCDALVDNCESLLDANTTSGRAFEWLVDPTFNPRVESYPDEKVVTRFALASLYYSTNGDEWVQNSNWLTKADECGWFFSTRKPCNSAGSIITLALDNNNLLGEVPREIGILTTLSRISLQNPVDARPSLTGELPSTLQDLAALTSLTITGNHLSGRIPDNLGSLSNLQELDLSANNLSGDIPLSFANLRSIETLRLSNNRLTGAVPSSFLQSASSLRELFLDKNAFTSVSPEVAALDNLKVLNMQTNELATFPLALTQLFNLQTLDLSRNNLRALPSEIGLMSGLHALYLSTNDFSGRIPDTIGNLFNLTTLELSDCQFSGPIPSRMGLLMQLQNLYLNSNVLTGNVPPEFVRLKQLQVMRLDDNNLQGQFPVLVCANLANQQVLSYADCHAFTNTESCITYCCGEDGTCQCQFESTDYKRCYN